MLSPQEVSRAMRNNNIPPAPREKKRKSVSDPTADAESQLEVKALFYAGWARIAQGHAQEAIPLLQKAADSGHVPSMEKLSHLYLGLEPGVAVDHAKAEEVLMKAARLDAGFALIALGKMHRDEIARKPGKQKAAEYFIRSFPAESRGEDDSIWAGIGATYLITLFERPSERTVRRVLKFVESGGRLEPRGYIALASQLDRMSRDRISRENDSSEVAADLKERANKFRAAALTELERSLSSGTPNPEDRYLLATLYVEGFGTTEQRAQAPALFRTAAEEGHAPARFRAERPAAESIKARLAAADLGRASTDEEPVAGLDTKQVELIETAAKAGDSEAQVELGKLHLDGIGREKSADKALAWFREAASAGSAEGAYQLGLCHSRGIGTRSNTYNAALVFERAALMNHAGGMYEFGRALYEGRGVKTDKAAAVQWWNKAASAGSGRANYRLGRLLLLDDPQNSRQVEAATSKFLQGARQGDPRAQLEFLKVVFGSEKLDELFETRGASAKEVFRWSKSLSESSDLNERQRKLAALYLGRCHALGIGTQPDTDEAARFFQAVANLPEDGIAGSEAEQARRIPSQTTTFKFPVDGEMTQFTRWGSGKKLVIFFNNNAVDFGPDDPGRLRPFDKMPKNIEGALQAYTSLMDEGYSLVVWDYPFIPRFSRPFFLEVSDLQQVEAKPDFSGIASSVVEGIREETGATEMILVGNSMGGGVLLWDLDKIASMDGVRTLLLSPTEFFMPPIDRLSGPLPNTTLISIAPDPYLQSPEFKAWAAKHASPPGGALEEDLGEDSNHLIIGRDRLTHEEVARLVQQAAQSTNPGGSATAPTR